MSPTAPSLKRADQGMGDPVGTPGAGDNGAGRDGDPELLEFGLPVPGTLPAGHR